MATVLLLDRDRRSCRDLHSLLGAHFAVVACHSFFRAFQQLRLHKFDLVLVKTADKDAFATAMLSQIQQEGVRIPTIVLNGHGASHDTNLLRQLGARQILHYPLPRTRLLAAIAAESQLAGRTDEAPIGHVRKGNRGEAKNVA